MSAVAWQEPPPPPIAAPKGIAGLLEGSVYEPGTVLDTSKDPQSMVYVNVYDVSESEVLQTINQVTTGNNNVLVGGVFHAGVEVYGAEWCYGFAENRTGIAAVRPRLHPQHNYRVTVPMGATRFSENEVRQLVMQAMEEWRGNDYHLIHHNCLSFCNAFLNDLGLGRLPGWIDRAARAASFLDQTSKRVHEDTQRTIELVRSLTSDLEHKVPMDANEAIGSVREEAAKIAEMAQAQVQEVHASALLLGERAQEALAGFGFGRFGQTFSNREEANQSTSLSNAVGDTTEEVHKRAKVPWQAIGSDLWLAVNGFAESVRAPGGATSSQAADAAATTLARGAADERGAHGLVRMQEERLLTEGLLADEDSDALVFQRHGGSSTSHSSKNGVISPHFKIEEAPADWLSSLGARKVSALAPDLLTGIDEPGSPSKGRKKTWQHDPGDLLGDLSTPQGDVDLLGDVSTT